ncbi:MAG: cyclic nucleotide-binding domain-containing protein [Proteobacteria bacterium]|nr:cyclic nucleotide-binding domain-containing protein [Pseudomonadota bacterium]
MPIAPQDAQHLPLFRICPRHYYEQACALALTSFDVGAGEVLLEEGEQDDSLMVVLEGSLEIIAGDPAVQLATVGEGELLGDMALFGGSGRRSATVRTLTPCRLVLIEQTGLDILRVHGNALIPILESVALRTLGRRLREMNEHISRMGSGTEFEDVAPDTLLGRLAGLFGKKKNTAPTTPRPSAARVLAESNTFLALPADARDALARGLEVVPCPAGTVLLKEGMHGGDAYVVADGQIDVYRATRSFQNEKVAEFGPGTFFGLVSLVHGSVRSATCYAPTPTWLLKLPGELYSQLEGEDSHEGRAMRRVVYGALSSQLENANAHVALLVSVLANDPTITDRERKAYRQLIVSGV